MTREDNQNAAKHGAEGAIKRISEGKPFIGLAKEEQTAVEIIFQENGIDAIVKSDAIRLQTALNLYWNAVKKAAADGDLNAFDKYVSRFGWLSGVALRAWDQVKRNEKESGKGRVSVVDILSAYDSERTQDSTTTQQDALGESE